MSRRRSPISPAICIVLALLLSPALLHGKQDKIEDVVATVGKAIVDIRTEELTDPPGDVKNDNIFKRFFTPETEDEAEASDSIGSGVVLDPSGLIVTNEHLISKAVTITVRFSNRQEYEANVIAADPEFDIALLKVDGKKEFPYLKVRKKNVRVGERAIVIGNPFNLANSVTTGVISALGRNLRINNKVYANLIQTDAPINPGNSGGALLDGEGNLIGIVTAIYQEGKGIGFAIPIEDVMSMLSEFNEHAGKRPILGMFVDRKKDDDSGQYLYVNKVISGSPAEEYGVKPGDRIVEIDGKKVREGMKLQNVFRKAGMNGTNRIRVMRGDDPVTVSIERSVNYMPTPLDENLCGVRLADIQGYAKLKFKLKQKNGVVVTKVFKGGIGERYGLKAGDVIVKINNGDVNNKGDFQTLMVEGLRRNYVLYQVKRNENLFFVPIKLDALL